MKKSSQNQPVDATTLAFPEHVSVAMAEIAEHVGEGLLALAVGAGLQVMQTLMDADVTALAGPKGKHDQGRIAVRHGREHGSVSLGGRRVPVTRPRVRAADGTGELPIPSYELFTSTEILGKMAMEKMLAGLSTRRYPVGLEPVGAQISGKSSATSKSAVSRRFVAMTETALVELLAADLCGLDLVACWSASTGAGGTALLLRRDLSRRVLTELLGLLDGEAYLVYHAPAGVGDLYVPIVRLVIVPGDGVQVPVEIRGDLDRLPCEHRQRPPYHAPALCRGPTCFELPSLQPQRGDGPVFPQLGHPWDRLAPLRFVGLRAAQG